jgi:hypothetical protein
MKEIHPSSFYETREGNVSKMTKRETGKTLKVLMIGYLKHIQCFSLKVSKSTILLINAKLIYFCFLWLSDLKVKFLRISIE